MEQSTWGQEHRAPTTPQQMAGKTAQPTQAPKHCPLREMAQEL